MQRPLFSSHLLRLLRLVFLNLLNASLNMLRLGLCLFPYCFDNGFQSSVWLVSTWTRGFEVVEKFIVELERGGVQCNTDSLD
jgi:hypothetical protein